MERFNDCVILLRQFEESIGISVSNTLVIGIYFHVQNLSYYMRICNLFLVFVYMIHPLHNHVLNK